MRVVIDTNVIVSALLKAGSRPHDVLRAALEGRARALLDGRILAEYRDVLARPKFCFDAAKVARFLARFEAVSESVAEVAQVAFPLPDLSDRPFVEVAISGRADAIVTGNAKHFPEAIGIRVLTPAAFMAELDDA